ncbi:MAG TPA: oligopeptide transporter, OPT family [Armatimonadetes bacterium]|nr:oligopeptide transporter, OPT family [Armatimonadota bacterium]
MEPRKSEAEAKQTFQPYIPPEQSPPEFTLIAVVLGAVLGAVFGVANAYLGLRVGMTVSASIPAAVISMAILRGLLKRGTILENNLAQTIGSSGEGLAAGVIFTLPAFLLLGLSPPTWQIILLCFLGGFLGILMMIPLRHYLMAEEHGRLPFPEGTACAEILMAGDEGGAKARQVFEGVLSGGLYKFLMMGLRLWKENLSAAVPGLPGGAVGLSGTPALLGVGALIGPRIAAVLFSGAVIGYLVLAPLLAYVGRLAPELILPPADLPLSQMGPGELRRFYIKYIGVGAVAMGGLVSLLRALPAIVSSLRGGWQALRRRSEDLLILRTEADLPLPFVFVGSLLLAVGVWVLPGVHLGFVGSLVVVVFGFLFVAVAARIVGLVGSSSSPVSGMTIATLLVAALLFRILGRTGTEGTVAALTVAAVVCIAICMAGDASQDLKTGFLVGATPKWQQIAEFVGVAIPALFMAGTLQLLHRTFVIGSQALPAPQATLMATVARGVMEGTMPWLFVGLGLLLALGVELLGVASLPFAIGLYLPFALSTPILLGGWLSGWLRRGPTDDGQAEREERNLLLSSGLVAGDALMGVLIALLLGIPTVQRWWSARLEGGWMGGLADVGSLAAFLLLAGWFYLKVSGRRFK